METRDKIIKKYAARIIASLKHPYAIDLHNKDKNITKDIIGWIEGCDNELKQLLTEPTQPSDVEIEKALSDNLTSFRKKNPQLDSGDLQTFILGWGYAIAWMKKHHTPISSPDGKEFEIDFSGHCKARICINNNIPTVEAAVNGYGDAIDIIDINDISIYNQPTSTTKQNNTDNGNTN